MGDVQGVICAGGNYPRRKLSGFNYLGANFPSGNYVGGGVLEGVGGGEAVSRGNRGLGV